MMRDATDAPHGGFGTHVPSIVPFGISKWDSLESIIDKKPSCSLGPLLGEVGGCQKS